jgi:hypothetical protein
MKKPAILVVNECPVVWWVVRWERGLTSEENDDDAEFCVHRHIQAEQARDGKQDEHDVERDIQSRCDFQEFGRVSAGPRDATIPEHLNRPADQP